MYVAILPQRGCLSLKFREMAINITLKTICYENRYYTKNIIVPLVIFFYKQIRLGHCDIFARLIGVLEIFSFFFLTTIRSRMILSVCSEILKFIRSVFFIRFIKETR